MARKRKDINLFEKSREIQKTGRLSDKDYLDMLEENSSAPRKEPESTPESTLAPGAKKEQWVRHTFVITPENLQALRDIVHTIKSTGNYQYSQKQALDEAINLLKAKVEAEMGEIHPAPKS